MNGGVRLVGRLPRFLIGRLEVHCIPNPGVDQQWPGEAAGSGGVR